MFVCVARLIIYEPDGTACLTLESLFTIIANQPVTKMKMMMMMLVSSESMSERSHPMGEGRVYGGGIWQVLNGRKI